MIQNQLGKVIDGHRYTNWLRKQVDETDVQMAKYKNRIEVLQKHVIHLPCHLFHSFFFFLVAYLLI
jgi:hypothetical protein